MRKLDKTILFRFLVSIVLAGAALGLFLMSRANNPKPPEQRQRDIAEIVNDVDRDVDSVLAHFHIEKRSIRKQQLPVPNANISRTERRIAVPPDLVSLQLNLALNTMAKQYDGRAIASENMKENTVTIHIELEGYIVQTIILKTTVEPKRQSQAGKRIRT